MLGGFDGAALGFIVVGAAVGRTQKPQLFAHSLRIKLADPPVHSPRCFHFVQSSASLKSAQSTLAMISESGTAVGRAADDGFVSVQFTPQLAGHCAFTNRALDPVHSPALFHFVHRGSESTHLVQRPQLRGHCAVV
jgi:hypothetical protein